MNALYDVVTGKPKGFPLSNTCKRTINDGHGSAEYKPENRNNGSSSNFS